MDNPLTMGAAGGWTTPVELAAVNKWKTSEVVPFVDLERVILCRAVSVRSPLGWGSHFLTSFLINISKPKSET